MHASECSPLPTGQPPRRRGIHERIHAVTTREIDMKKNSIKKPKVNPAAPIIY
jgi:hypothetical protein